MKLGEVVYKDTNIQTLLDVIDKADDQVRKEVLRAISTKLTQAGKIASINTIKEIMQTTDPAVKAWISEAIPKSYTEGINFNDFEFQSIRLEQSVARDALNNTVRGIRGLDSTTRAQLMAINTRNIRDWGDLQNKMGKVLNYEPVAMGDVRFSIIKEWEKYTIDPKVRINAQSISKGYKTSKLRVTPEEIKIARDLSVHAETVNALMSSTYLDFANGMNGMVRGAEQKINEAYKKQIRAKIIAKEITGKSIQKVKKEIADLLGDKGFSVLTDRGGHTWTLRRYSEMLARTHVMKASNEALINRAGQFDVDLIQVSTHSGACPICTPHEGRVFSLSGKHPEYPEVDIDMPIHPNCRHVFLMRPDLA